MKTSRVKEKYVNNIKTIQDLIRTTAEIYDEMTAVKFKREKEIEAITYRQLWHDVSNVAEIFTKNNWKGKYIALIGTLDYDWLVVYLAVVCSGNVAVPIDMKADDLEEKTKAVDLAAAYVDKSVKNEISILHGLNQRIVFGNRSDKDWLNIHSCMGKTVGSLAIIDVSKDDEAMVVFTSGTTGNSKGVVLTHNNIISNTKCGLYFIEDIVGEGHTIMPVLPPTHMLEVTVGLLTPFYYGVSICFGDSLKYLSNNMKLYKPDVLILVPMIVENIYDKIMSKVSKDNNENKLNRIIKVSNLLRFLHIDLRNVLFRNIRSIFGGNLKIIVCGGAALSPAMVEYFNNFGITIREGYGITECSPVISCNRLQRYKDGSVGVKGPDDYCQVSIIGGEICVKGDIVFKGYYQDEASTTEVMEDGWFHTGDLGYVDEDGFIFITGRKKNLIILSDGNNVSPEEIEKYFSNCDLIGSIFITSKIYSGKNLITAFIHPNCEDADEAELKDIEDKIREVVKEVNFKLPPYKKIQKIEFSRNEFEKTSLGKIRRFKY